MTEKYDPAASREEWLKLIEERRNPFYRQPNKDAKIWRYMDFPKFVSLLNDAAVFFSRADALGDPFEGSVSLENVRQRPLINEQTIQDFAAKLAALEHSDAFNEGEMRAHLARSDTVWALQRTRQRPWTYLSCWHVGEHESAAMWRLYASDNGSIAIQSTFGRLEECLRAHREPPMGEPILALVNYVDYEREPVRVNVHLSEYFYKRASFAHENELRAIVQRVPLVPISWDHAGNVTGRIIDLKAAPIPGVTLKVDLTQLIERVHVAPGAPEWLASLVKNVVGKYALNIPVHQSGLDSKPVY